MGYGVSTCTATNVDDTTYLAPYTKESSVWPVSLQGCKDYNPIHTHIHTGLAAFATLESEHVKAKGRATPQECKRKQE